MPFTGILLVLLIVAMAVATFIESSLGTPTAWAVVYDAWWFELLFALVVINLLGNIIQYKLYRKAKLTVFIFHAAFIFIILGGAITRYFSDGGMMRIREGSASSSITSDKTYMDVVVSNGQLKKGHSERVLLSPLTPKAFSWSGSFNGERFRVRSREFIRNAVPQYVASPGGVPYVQMVLLTDRQYRVGLAGGEDLFYPGISVSLNKEDSEALIRLFSRQDMIYALAHDTLAISAMGMSETTVYPPGDTVLLEQGKLLTLRSSRIVLQRFIPSARLQYVRNESGMQGSGTDVVRMEVEYAGMTSALFLPGMKNVIGETKSLNMGDVKFSLTYGAHSVAIPFVLKLNDFIIERYPGSNSPSSFESKVLLIDQDRGITEERRIYMNNVLKHRGYRFYQSSYDQDEKGTILSVKKDTAGTFITYVGYFFLMLGMFLAMFAKGTRFSRLVKVTGQSARIVASVMIVFLLATAGVMAQSPPTPSRADAAEFGRLWVQGKEGRFKPVNTLSNEVLRKITGKSHYDGKSSDQVLLGMIVYPDEWKNTPLFEVEHPELQQMLGYKGSVVSFNDFVSERGGYILSDLVNQAYNKRVQDRTDLDKEVMKLDERINVFYLLQTGGLLKIYPIAGDTSHRWKSVADHLEGPGTVSDTLGQVFLVYTHALRDGDSELSAEIVSFIEGYQVKNSEILPTDTKKRAEILYNRLNIFNRLIVFYLLFGFLLIALQFLRVYRPAKWVEYLFKVGVIHLAVAFVLHASAFILRWYVSGHAPLSNGFESMIFVSLISLLAGLIFVRRTGFALALTAILSALSLLVAHMSWMNPEITNLVPVLKSPWLTIHVTVIMAGYGFLGLSALSGLTNLIFYILQTKRNQQRIEDVVNQLTRVNHLSVIIGLYFLTAGVFLGGVWANESWGRYWGWDPKETWALISVMVYAFITHMHRFPGMKGSYAFNLASLLGYGAILMTYFGVNYFLGGIHSYAGGAAFQIPWFVYVSIFVIFLIALVAYNRQRLLKIDYLEENETSLS
jgi:cytochrome c-type biogenesis protein CcsB